MKLFRNGFWQKAITILVVLLELALVVYLCVVFAEGGIQSHYAIFFLLAFWLLSLVFGIFIVNSGAENEYKVGWLFLVGSFPLVGAVFYLLFAHKLTTKKAKAYSKRYYELLTEEPKQEGLHESLSEYSKEGARIVSLIEKERSGRLFSNSEVSYYPLGDDVFPKMIEELEKAKHFIFIEFFIIKPGTMWYSILSILKEKAKQGVDVRLIYDDVGNLGATPPHYDRTLRKMGIKAHAYRPIKPFLDVRMNNRNHRKIMVIDGHTAFSGGINIADEYINKEERFGHWKDNAIMVKGKAVYGYTLLFIADYESNFGKIGKHIDYSLYEPEKYIDEAGGFPASDGYIIPYGDIPYDDTPIGEEVYISILGGATDYIYMSTPYFLPDEKMRSAIVRASLGGVDTRLLVPKKPDKKLVFELTRKNYGELLRKGVKVYEYTPGFVHQKTFVSDDKVAAIGTINIDYRSLYLHSENATVLIGNSSIKSIKQDFLDTFAVSEEITLEKWKKMRRKKIVLWIFLRLFEPLL